jgi:hypothetical protein
MTDSYGLNVTVAGGGASAWVFARSDGTTIHRNGSEAQAAATAAALSTFAAMRPESVPDPPPPADPVGFGLAIFQDPTISGPVKFGLEPWVSVLGDQIANPVVIATAWAGLVQGLGISSQDRATIAAYAVQYRVPGIS